MVLMIPCSVKNAAEFKQWSKSRASKYVYELKEQNSISYEWHLSADGTEATLIESFIDSDSMMVRSAIHGASLMASEVFEHVDITSVLCMRNIKPDAIDTLSAWGAKFHAHHCGYNRGEIIVPR